MIFVTAYLGGSHGTAKSARDFLRALLACLPEVKVISPTQENFPTELCGQSLSTPIWLEAPEKIYIPKRIWKIRSSNLKNWSQEFQKRSELKKISRYETAIVNGWASYSYWLQIENIFKGRKVMIVRESPRHIDGSDCPITLQDLIDGLSTFDALIFVSQRLQQEWLDFPELCNKQSFYLPNCCEEEEVQFELTRERNLVRKELGLSPDEFVIVCPAGTIEQRKGQDLLANILPELFNNVPNLRLLMIGNVATTWGEDLLNNLKLSPYSKCFTHWTSRPSVLDIIHVSDVLAFPSRAEAMPRTILEAMALKVPVVASAVDGVPELIIDGHTGILFNSNNSQGLLQGLLQIASDPKLGYEFAKLGHTRYWENFSRCHQFYRLKKLLTELDKECLNKKTIPKIPFLNEWKNIL